MESCISENDNNTLACKTWQTEVPSAVAREGLSVGLREDLQRTVPRRWFMPKGDNLLKSESLLDSRKEREKNKIKKRLPLFEKMRIQTGILKRTRG